MFLQNPFSAIDFTALCRAMGSSQKKTPTFVRVIFWLTTIEEVITIIKKHDQHIIPKAV